MEGNALLRVAVVIASGVVEDDAALVAIRIEDRQSGLPYRQDVT